MMQKDGRLTFAVDLSYLAHLLLHHSKPSVGGKCVFFSAGLANRNDNSDTEVRSFHLAQDALGVKIAVVNSEDQKASS